MNSLSKLSAALLAAVALVGFTPAIAGEAGTGVGPTPAQVEAAKSPADHAAIARAYDDEAVALESKAAAHAAMARTYRAGGAPKANAAAMTAHCERLESHYRDAAAAARALAAEHRTLAGASGG